MIVLKGKPQSTNHLYGHQGRRVFLTSDGRDTKLDYQWQAKMQWKNPVILDEIELNIRLFFPDGRRRDWDNWHKISMDSLNGIVWKDDKQIYKATVEKFIDKRNPRIEIDVICPSLS